jgi:hypothetical protein
MGGMHPYQQTYSSASSSKPVNTMNSSNTFSNNNNSSSSFNSNSNNLTAGRRGSASSIVGSSFGSLAGLNPLAKEWNPGHQRGFMQQHGGVSNTTPSSAAAAAGSSAAGSNHANSLRISIPHTSTSLPHSHNFPPASPSSISTVSVVTDLDAAESDIDGRRGGLLGGPGHLYHQHQQHHAGTHGDERGSMKRSGSLLSRNSKGMNDAGDGEFILFLIRPIGDLYTYKHANPVRSATFHVALRISISLIHLLAFY